MPLTLLRFHFNAPLHIGNVRADYDRSESMLHSDTLYAAIMQAWSVLGMSDCISEEPPFTLSSLFPFCGQANDERVYFFPKPYGRLKDEAVSSEDKHRPEAKKLKKVQYYDQSFFEQFLHQQRLKADGYLADFDDAGNKGRAFAVQGIYLTKKKIDREFMVSEVYPRARVPRFGETDKDEKGRVKAKDTEIFYIERIFFKPGSGLFCLAQFDDEITKRNVLAALSYLQDEGLGTDRHVGHGLFKLESEENFKLSHPDSEYAMNLSLFCPQSRDQLGLMIEENIEKPRTAFETIKRGGWITAEPYLSYRKKSVYMFKEGSIFRLAKDLAGFQNPPGLDRLKTGGQTVNLQPDIIKDQHPIYRVGKALFVPVNLS